MATRKWDELIQYHNKDNQDIMWKEKLFEWNRQINETDANDDGDDDAITHFTACVALHIEHTTPTNYIHWGRVSWARIVLFLAHFIALTLTQTRALSALHSWSSTCHPWERPLHLELHSLLPSFSSCLSSTSPSSTSVTSSSRSSTRRSWKTCATPRPKGVRAPTTSSTWSHT